jgi:hypothetical protein
MPDPDYKALCAELLQECRALRKAQPANTDLWDRARTALSQPETVAPTDEELEELAEPFSFVGEDGWTRSVYDEAGYARAVLARWGTPANNTRGTH